MAETDREALAGALADLEPIYGRWLADPDTTVEPYPTPFFKRFRIYRVVYRAPHDPVGLYAAWAPGEPAYVLSDEPQNFVMAAVADPVALSGPAEAVAYVRAYLETTRSLRELFYLVDSVEAVRYYPNPDSAEQQRIAEFKAKYAGIIAPPAAQADEDGWQVTAYALREQALERLALRVTPFGALSLEGQVLEGGLPVVFGG